MDSLIGSWKPKKGTEKNEDAFMDAAGIPAEMKAVYKSREYFITYTKEGPKLKCVVKVVNDPSLKEEVIECELDQEFEFVDMDKQKTKGKISFDGKQFNETYTNDGGQVFTVVRQVSGNIMSTAMTFKGVTTSQEWEKC